VLGAALRLTWGDDIEYKGDERYVFELSQQAGVSRPWPRLGMHSSAKLRNPGMSVWVFILLGRIGRVSSPVGLARAVQAVNIAAMIGIVPLARWLVRREDREMWLWAAALVAVSPYCVLLDRKLWAPSLLPPACLAMLAGWLRRETRWGAILWGVMGALLGQLHMAAFFYVAGFAAWTLLGEWRSGEPRRTRWAAWLVGSALGGVPLVPWLIYLVYHPGDRSEPLNSARFLALRFWYYWLRDSTGLMLQAGLGYDHLASLLRQPYLRGRPTFLIGAAHVASACAAALLMLVGLAGALRARRRWPSVLSGGGHDTERALFGSLLAGGFAMTALAPAIFYQYLNVTFPLMWVGWAYIALATPRWGRPLLVLSWTAQLVVSVAFLVYIHQHDGAPGGDYGTVYRAQR
jgi:hypothetical protein